MAKFLHAWRKICYRHPKQKFCLYQPDHRSAQTVHGSHRYARINGETLPGAAFEKQTGCFIKIRLYQSPHVPGWGGAAECKKAPGSCTARSQCHFSYPSPAWNPGSLPAYVPHTRRYWPWRSQPPPLHLPHNTEAYLSGHPCLLPSVCPALQ